MGYGMEKDKSKEIEKSKNENRDKGNDGKNGLDTHAGCASSESCGCHCHHKAVPRSEETVRSLKNRLSRLNGQIDGLSRMLDDNRYCGDILIQVAAAESALQSFGYLILKEHMETCVAEDVRNGSLTVMDETLDLIKKLK